MNNRNLICGLAVFVIALLAVAIIVATKVTVPAPAYAIDEYLEALTAFAPKIDAIEVQSGDSTLRLERGNNGWTIPSRNGYGAKAESVQELVRGLIALDADQQMTSKPERHHELGVAWPDIKKEAQRIRLFAEGSKEPVLDVILGRAVQSPTGVYLRKSSENQAYRCRGSLRVSADIAAWLAGPVSEIPSSAIQQIDVDGATLTQKDSQWSFLPPTSTEPDPRRDAIKATIPYLLSGFQPEDVRAASAEDALHPNQIAAIFHLDADHAVDARVWKESDGVWVKLSLGECSAVPNEALDKYAPMWQGWVFRLPAWRGGQFDPLFAPPG